MENWKNKMDADNYLVTDRERISECLSCSFIDIRFETVKVPEEYEDGRCRTKDEFMETGNGKGKQWRY